MRFFDYIKLAFKNISKRKLRSFLTIISIVIGALSVVTVLTLMFSAKKVFKKQLEAEGAFSQITIPKNIDDMGGGPFGDSFEDQPEGDDIDLNDEAIKSINNIDHVIDVSAQNNIWSFRFIRSEGGESQKSNFQTYQPGLATNKKLLAGRNFTKEDGVGITILDSDIAEEIGFDNPNEAIGKTVIFTSEEGYQGYGAEIPPPSASEEEWDEMSKKVTEIEAKIIGVTPPPTVGEEGGVFLPMEWGRKVLSWGNWEYNEEAYLDFEEKMNSQGIYDWDERDCKKCFTLTYESNIDREGYDTLIAKVDDPSNTKKVAEKIKSMGYAAITAHDFLEIFEQIATIIASIFAGIGAISLGVATIGIINTMLMATYERTREIGVMRACGAKRRTIRRLFMFESATIGFFGGIVGILIAEIIIIFANHYLNQMLVAEGMAGQNVATFPFELALATIGITTLLGILSGFYPAYKAAKVNPVEALRYE